MGKLAGKKEALPKIKKTGRPTLADRIKKPSITALEKRYAEHRSSGLSIAESAKAVGLPEREMFSRERNLPALKAEIEARRGERFHVDLDKMSALQFKLLTDLDKRLTDLLMSDKLTIADIAKGYEMLHAIKADQDSIIEQARKEEKMDKPKEHLSFAKMVEDAGGATQIDMAYRKMIAGLSLEDRKAATCPDCPFKDDKPQAKTKRRRKLKDELSVV